MLTLPFVIFKSLAWQGNSLRLIRGKITFRTSHLRCLSSTATSELKVKKSQNTLLDRNKISNEQVKLAIKLIIEYSEPESIRWNELINKLKDSHVSNTRSAVLQGCLKIQNAKAGLSFYNYLMKSGEGLTVMDYMVFSKLFNMQKDILKDESLIKSLYYNMKDHINESPLLLEIILNLAVRSRSCFFDFVEKIQGEIGRGGKELILTKALDYDRFDLVLDILKEHDPLLNESFISAYFNYLTRVGLKGKSLPDLVTFLTETCEKNASSLVCSNLPSILAPFVETLNQNQTDYSWSVKECKIDTKSVCSECGYQLLDKPLSDVEFKTLQESCFSNIGLLSKNVFLSSSEKEFEAFKSFLNTCKPYDVVLDLLNIFYKEKHFRIDKLNTIIQYFSSRGQDILIIGKKHIKKKFMKEFLINLTFKDKLQVFFTDNMSDDDVFLLYAAMHSSPGKYIVSSDYYTHYVPHFSNEHKNLFLRWKIYHQFLFDKQKLIPPCPHLGVPQLTTTPCENKEKFIWHLSYKPDNSSPKLNCNPEIKWLCLEAVKK